MIDRLIELLKEANDIVKRNGFGFNAYVMADHLLANGVIMPPCKVGDTVYIVDGTTDGIVIGEITNIEYNIYTTPREWITVSGNYPFFGKLEEKNRIDLLLGKTVFLTREEAEQSLQKVSVEND